VFTTKVNVYYILMAACHGQQPSVGLSCFFSLGLGFSNHSMKLVPHKHSSALIIS